MLCDRRSQTCSSVWVVMLVMFASLSLLVIGLAETGLAQTGLAQPRPAQTPPLTIFKNYFVTGDYVVSGWVEHSSANGFAKGTISIPDQQQINALGSTPPAGPTTVPTGADIVAAYLYWGTVEGNQSSFVGQRAFFNGYKITGDVLGNPNAPTSWSSGGCSGGSVGSKTMRAYRADVRPYLPLDLDASSPTFGALVANGPITVQMADSGSNGNTQPNALGATLVVIYRVLSPPAPLNAIVLYDGSYAPSNSMPAMTQQIIGFYQPDGNHAAKLTHIVANGQQNKGEIVYFGPTLDPVTQLPSNTLNSLYGQSVPPFPGIYGAWDNPTWDVSSYVHGGLLNFDQQEFTSVVPTSSNSGCVNWGAIVMSTTVQDTDSDGLLDIWEQSQGYTDAVSGQQIALPGANAATKDLFIEVDYLTARDALGNVLHSHLPKQQALDIVGEAFHNQGISVHFDLPSGIYMLDPYVISTGVGGNEIPENPSPNPNLPYLLCMDPASPPPGSLCAFPNQPAVSWKGGFEGVQNDPALGNFQPGRAQSYHYALFGHSLGEPRTYWGAWGPAFVASDPQDFAAVMTQLVSIVDIGNVATVTIKTPSLVGGVAPLVPPLVVKPGDCLGAPPLPLHCSDANSGRVTISGSLTAPFVPNSNPPQLAVAPLNGTYTFSSASSGPPDINGVITTTFQVATSGVQDGTYQFSCPSTTVPACIAEPQLGLSYLGPTSTSGHGDFGGGGDFAVTLGLWGADDVAGCQPDPSQSLAQGQVYCENQVGKLKVQEGSLMHELGHTLTLTHGGTYYDNQTYPSLPRYELNCKSNFVSDMNYLFQVRGFVDGGLDYSGQELPALNEAALDENNGIGLALYSGQPSAHPTAWYSTPNPLDSTLQDQAKAHCDGTPLLQSDVPAVRVDATFPPLVNFSAPLDWNNDLIIDNVTSPIDVNYNGSTADTPFSGYNDWQAVNLLQMSARASGFGFSDGGGPKALPGGGPKALPGGGIDPDSGGPKALPGGGPKALPGGGPKASPGGGEQDEDTATSTVNAPFGLKCTQQLTTMNGTVVPGCTSSPGSFLEKGKAVPLTWSPPGFGQIRFYTVWRAVGSFSTRAQIKANIKLFNSITTLTGAPPAPAYIDPTVKSNTTYTYFVANTNKQGAVSGASSPVVVTVKF